MRIKLLHHASEWLPDDVEPPAPLSRQRELNSFRVERSADGALLSARVDKGAAIWNGSGKLLHYEERGADFHLSPKKNEILALENTFGRCTNQSGIKHRVRRLDAATFRTIAEADICVPIGGVEYLIVDHH